jgi:AraC family transcriptional regulator, melibiose operon regulatory protein
MNSRSSQISQAKAHQIEIIGLNIGLNQTVDMPYSHRHDEIELNFVEKGAIAYLFAGKPGLVEISQMALFWGANPHRLIWADQPTWFDWLTIPLPLFLQWNLPPELVKPVLQGELLTNHSPLLTAQAGVYRQLFRQWNVDLHSDYQHEGQRRAAILEVQALLHRLGFQATRPTPDFNQELKAKIAENKLDYPQLDKVEQMARFIAEHYSLPLSIKQIAGVVGLHPNYAMRVFHKIYGVSILNYLTHHRLAHAQRLLATTDQPVLEIALASGITSISRFYTIFKAYWE